MAMPALENALEEARMAIDDLPERSRVKPGLQATYIRIKNGGKNSPSPISLYNAAVNELALLDDPTEQARIQRTLLHIRGISYW